MTILNALPGESLFCFAKRCIEYTHDMQIEYVLGTHNDAQILIHKYSYLPDIIDKFTMKAIINRAWHE